MILPTAPGKIGIFDSGYGGLTILREIQALMPRYDYIYLGDNARAPYGTRSFEVVYEFTRQAVLTLFNEGCHLVILACNTASAKALRTIQQVDLPRWDASRRVLGIIRPTIETIDHFTETKHIGLLGTEGTILSQSYELEIEKIFPHITVSGQACPMWVSLIENNEFAQPGADYYVKKYIDALLQRAADIDALVLGCTHYPLLLPKIRQFTPAHIRIVEQGALVAGSLREYLSRHPEIEDKCTKAGTMTFYTTEAEEKFRQIAARFWQSPANVTRIQLN